MLIHIISNHLHNAIRSIFDNKIVDFEKYNFIIYIVLFYTVEIHPTMKKHDLQHHAIITQLQKIGLNATDATIYLAAIRLGASSISTIAQEAAIHRITAHDSVQRLLDK